MRITYRGYTIVSRESDLIFMIFDGDEEIDQATSLNEAKAVIDDWLNAR